MEEYFEEVINEEKESEGSVEEVENLKQDVMKSKEKSEVGKL